MTKVNTALSIAAVAAALSLGGCASWPDSLNPGSWWESADGNTNVKGPDRTYPKLSSVPERPPPRDEAAQKQAEQQLKADRDAGRTVATTPPDNGLAADRDAARYTDDDLKREQAKPAAAPPPPPPPSPPQAAPAAAAASPPPAASGQTTRMELPRSAMPSAAPPAPVSASREAVRAAPVAPPPQTAPAPQQAALPANAPPPPPAPPAAMAPEPPQVIAMAPVRSPGDPPPAGTEASTPSNLVWGPPPSDIALVRSGMAGPIPPSMVPALTPRRGGPVASVNFASGSARLGTNDEALLREVAQQYIRSGGTIAVIGHATEDAAGNDVRRQIANFSVSMDRATAVAQALQRYGVPGEAIAISAQVDGAASADVFLR